MNTKTIKELTIVDFIVILACLIPGEIELYLYGKWNKILGGMAFASVIFLFACYFLILYKARKKEVKQ